MIVAVLGDSISKVRVLPGPVPCGFPTQISCTYDFTGRLSYPAQIERDLGIRIVNLAIPGSETTVPRTLPSADIPSMLDEVPLIPSNADAVIFEGGTNDISINGSWPGLYDRIDVVAAAIRRQAPRSRIVFVGVREFNTCEPPLQPIVEYCRHGEVTSWNRRLQAVAMQYGGAYVDTRSRWPAGASTFWPDGTHPSEITVLQLARMVERALR